MWTRSLPRGLTVLAALRPGEEERLRDVLRAIGDDIRGKTLIEGVERPHIDFSRSRTTHFARFAILDDPDRGPERKRLLYPRDVIKPYPPAQSLSMCEAHRLLRRARVFGPPLFDPVVLNDPTTLAGRKALLELTDDGNARGIHFFCVNASIRSQFEFVQQTWCNNPRFGGLNDNKDPVIGNNARTDQPSSHMTIPRRPFRERTAALPRFVKVRAGAYLFMPSLTALRFLAAFRGNRGETPE